MGVTVRGLRELIDDLEQLPAEAEKRFPKVVSHGALNIKTAWRRRWTPIGRAPHNAPHLAGGVGYDTTSAPPRWSAEIGVHPDNPQAALAHFPEHGSVRNAPLPGGLPSLVEEEPRFARAVADVAEAILDGR